MKSTLSIYLAAGFLLLGCNSKENRKAEATERHLIQYWESARPTRDREGSTITVKAFVYSDGTFIEHIEKYLGAHAHGAPSLVHQREGTYTEAFEQESSGSNSDGSKMLIKGIKGAKLNNGEESVFGSPLKGNYIAVWPSVLGHSFFMAPKPITESKREAMRHFPSEHWLSWLHISYPASFVMDPRSMEGEAKWWAKFDDPASELSVEMNSYGYISEIDLILTSPSLNNDNYREKLHSDERAPSEIIASDATYKNCGDYFAAMVAPKNAIMTGGAGFERYVSINETSAVFYFLDQKAYNQTSSQCYQTLRFNFPKGTYTTHKSTIEMIAESAKPAFATD